VQIFQIRKYFRSFWRYDSSIWKISRQLGMTSNKQSVGFHSVYGNFHPKLRDMYQPWLAPHKLRQHADALYAKGEALDFYWNFADRTLRPIYRPSQVSGSCCSKWTYYKHIWSKGRLQTRLCFIEGVWTLKRLQAHSIDQFARNLCIYLWRSCLPHKTPTDMSILRS